MSTTRRGCTKYMLALATSINGEVSKRLSDGELRQVAKAARLIGTARWMRARYTLSELIDLGVLRM